MSRKLLPPSHSIYVRNPHPLRNQYFGDMAINEAIFSTYSCIAKYEASDSYGYHQVDVRTSNSDAVAIAKAVVMIHMMWNQEDKMSTGSRGPDPVYEIVGYGSEKPEWVQAGIAEHDARIRERLR